MIQRKPLLLLAIILSFFRLDASIADSLEQVLPDTRGKERVDLLIRLSDLNCRTDQQRALDYGSEALKLAENINYKEGVADAFLHMSTAYYFLSNYNQAIEYLKQTLEIREQLNDTAMITDALNKIAINLRMVGQLEESLQFSFQALRIHERKGDSLRIASLLGNIGGIYKSMANFTKALEYYSESYQLYLNLQNEQGIAQQSNNLGIIFRTQGEYDKALEFYNRSLAIDQKLGNEREVAQSYNNIGNLYFLMGSNDEALDYFSRALAINRKINNVHSQAISLFFIGNIFEQLNQLNKAANSHEEALKLIEKTNNLEHKNNTLRSLARIYNAMGDYKKAGQYYADLIIIQDSIRKQQLNAVISEIDAKYESERKIQQIEQLKQENEIQELKLNESRIITYSFAALSFSVLVIALLLIQRYRLQTKQKNSELEQKLFRIQMNPHFIFNALNAIQSFTYKNDPLQAGKYLSNFSRLIRLVLNNSREEFITLDAEIRTLDYYMQLQRLRFKNKFDYSFSIDPLLHPEITLVPPMLAQPFIENSIEHGIQHITTKGNIRISFALLDDWIRFEIEDNGIGIHQSRILNSEKSEKHESLALSITEERLKILNRKNPKKIELLVREVDHENEEIKGTLITFSIPYKTMNARALSANPSK